MKAELKILMLEDLEEDAGLIVRALRKEGVSFDWKRVETHNDFVESLRLFLPDVILSDHALPQFNSIEALKLMKHEGITIPFILVTGTVSEEFAVSCLKLGADDYVLKSNLSRLPSAISQALKQYEIETKRKKAESDLRRQNEELIKINNELDNFVYSVSHNLRAPLMSTLGLIQLAQRDDKEQTFTHYWEMITKCIFNLDETLKEILDYSKNSRNEIAIDKIDLKKLTEEIWDQLKYLEGFDQISLRCEIRQSEDFYSDPFRISVILTNMLSNAIKYSNPYVRSYIDIHAIIDAQQAMIKIRDNGIGIPDELLPRIFDMFFRASEKSDGAGLGLYIVKETVEKLKGTIAVESMEDTGTTFTLAIPNIKTSIVSSQHET